MLRFVSDGAWADDSKGCALGICAARLEYTQPAVHGLAARQHKTACQPISACVKFGRNRKVEWKLDCRFASHRSCDPAVCVLVLKKIGRASCRERVCQYV